MKRYDPLKRVVDVAVSGVGLVVLAPVIALIAVAVRVQLGSPVLFRQQRPGQHGQLFTLVKFRTMRDGDGADDERLTRFGRWLRSSSLDELPELLNVLRGEMSLVGPRPLLVQYLDLYDDHQSRRHDVRPGITGLAQVSGRNLLNWTDRFDLDVDYVNRRSFLLDTQILVKTMSQTLKREGISEEGGTTMTPFTGSGSPSE